ncbi:helix-turn-helix domain-containing protein [Halorubellus sp. PRR65]|uniref:TrmB family transcriptional regulator n=1 Tax=Halorubellus sp. PRR65 TaxID=3098148 RepID=UPI002B25FA20|nr:helix-turn-helix domain-containing protein [Halorubellus sp. PRR65]
MTDLGELGLSSYEEEVYRTLLVTGAVTATDLANASGVPRGRIYDVLNGLESRQLVRTQPTDPARYVAVQPETAVDRLLAERALELRDEWTRYREVAADVRSNLLPTSPADGSVWLGSLGSTEMQTALQEHVQTATSTVHAVVGPPYESASWDTLEREVDAFFDGTTPDVSVSLLVSERVLETIPDAFFDNVQTHSATVHVRALADVPLSFDVIDQHVTTVDVPHPRRRGDRLGIVAVTDTDVVDEFERHFQALWNDAIPVTD